MSISISLGFPKITLSQLCAFYASDIQQKINDPKVSVLVSHSNATSSLQHYGTFTLYPKSSLVALSDESHSESSTQLCYIVRIVLEPVEQRSILYLSSLSRKACRPFLSTTASKHSAASKALDEIVLLRRGLERLYETVLSMMFLVDTKDLYHSMSTQINATDRSVQTEVNSVR